MAGPLRGLRVLEIAGIGPCPFAAMLLADMGAEVLRIDRLLPAATAIPTPSAPLARGRRSVGVDLKTPEGVQTTLRLAGVADALIEGFRPGVAERLGIGPEPCLARNPRLVYGRVTGWGRGGGYSGAAGHDINYIALAGALEPIGREGQAPVPPLNLVGDFGGGGMLLAFGVLCALLERERSGLGQVVDAAMVDGAALLTTMFHELRAAGLWSGPRGTNLLDGGAPFYDVYETSDGAFVSVGALEPQFYSELLRRLGLGRADLPGQLDRSGWPQLRERLAAVFRTGTRERWCELLENTDACFAPVLSLEEAPAHPHNRDRATFVEVGGVTQPAPAPRFSRSVPGEPAPAAASGEHTDAGLRGWGFSDTEIAFLRSVHAIA